MFMWEIGDEFANSPEQGFVTTDSDQPEAFAHLPELTNDQAFDVANHCYYSGADLEIAARVYAERGHDAMFNYCDTQNVYSMPGAPCEGVLKENFKYIGSGLTVPTIQAGA